MKQLRSLPMQILLALILGVATGLICAGLEGGAAFTQGYLKPFGTIFVNLLKFLVVPVVLFSMIEGIIGMDDMKKVGSVGGKTVLYFLSTTAIACVIGLAAANGFRALGLFPRLQLQEGAHWQEPTSANFMDTLVGMFPDNLWGALVQANMLQIILIAIGLGAAILAAGDRARLCAKLVSSVYAVLEKLMAFILRLSPIGVFSMIAWVIATQGAQILGSLALVLLCAYVAYAIHALAVYSLSAAVFAGMTPGRFFKGASAAMIFAFTSTSSAATLPVSKLCAEKLGADKEVSSFVLPLGATINMDGTVIYQAVAAVFLAVCCGMELSLGQMTSVVLTATLASIGTAGVSGAGTIMLAMVLTSIGIPVDMIMIIYGVDRLFDMGRTCLNVAGDLSCALCVSRWQNKKASL